jgi:hypothetical protein
MATLRDLILKHKSVQSISDERGADAGIWAYLNAGYHTGEGHTGKDRLHQCHEETWTALLAAVRGVEICDCEECTTLKAQSLAR